MMYPASMLRMRGVGMLLLCLVLSACENSGYPYYIKGPRLDVVFVLDNTGSVSECIATIKDSISAFAADLAGEAVQASFGVVSFGDTPAEQSSLDTPSTAEELSAWLGKLAGVNGGATDFPENPLDSIIHAYDNFRWRAGAQKCLVVITDYTCHQAGDGTLTTTRTVDDVEDILRDHATVYAVSPVLAGDIGLFGDVRWLADGYGAGPTVTLANYGTVRHSTGTGGKWLNLPLSGDIDLADIGLTDVP
jgi:hypothetical protein